MCPRRTTHIRRPEIVRAAMKVVGEGGVRSLTMAAIAREAGMTEMNLYRHFAGKEEILLAIGDRVGEEIMDRADRIAGGAGDAAGKLKAIFDSHVSAVSASPGIPRFVLSEEVHLGHPEPARRMAERLRRYVETLSRLVAEGVREGRFRRGVSPRETAMTLMGMIQIAVTNAFLGGNGGAGIGEEAERLWRNFLALLAEDGRG